MTAARVIPGKAVDVLIANSRRGLVQPAPGDLAESETAYGRGYQDGMRDLAMKILTIANPAKDWRVMAEVVMVCVADSCKNRGEASEETNCPLCSREMIQIPRTFYDAIHHSTPPTKGVTAETEKLRQIKEAWEASREAGKRRATHNAECTTHRPRTELAGVLQEIFAPVSSD